MLFCDSAIYQNWYACYVKLAIPKKIEIWYNKSNYVQ